MESLAVTMEDLGGLKRKLVITVPLERVQKAYQDGYQQIKSKVKINGFRNGKVPQSIIEKRFQSYMSQEALESIVPEYFQKAVDQESLFVADNPKFGDLEIDKKKPLVFSATFEVWPAVEFPQPESLKLEKKEASYTEEELEKQRQQHLTRAASFEEREEGAKAEVHDQLTIDFEGQAEGEPKNQEKDYIFSLGSGQFFKEFEEAITGMTKGETREFELTMPEDHPQEKLKGKKAQFKVTLKALKRRILPELDEAFFARYGEEVTNLEEFEELVKNELKSIKGYEIKNEQRAALKEQLLEKMDFEVPPSLLEQEIKNKLHQAGFTEGKEPSEEDKAKATQDAHADLRFSYFIQKTIEKESVNLDQDEVNRRFYMNAAMMGMNPSELIKQEYGRRFYQETYNIVAEEAVMDQLAQKVLKE